MAQKNDMCKAKLDYPCQWLYKVIGTDHEQLRQAIMEIITNIPCEINLSNSSSSGKYLCLNLEITVQNEKERDSIYLNLKAHPNIKIVL
jgi:putative lipoic acid-binding regulatory protein